MPILRLAAAPSATTEAATATLPNEMWAAILSLAVAPQVAAVQRHRSRPTRLSDRSTSSMVRPAFDTYGAPGSVAADEAVLLVLLRLAGVCRRWRALVASG